MAVTPGQGDLWCRWSIAEGAVRPDGIAVSSPTAMSTVASKRVSNTSRASSSSLNLPLIVHVPDRWRRGIARQHACPEVLSVVRQ
jgi:hypothetical protein